MGRIWGDHAWHSRVVGREGWELVPSGEISLLCEGESYGRGLRSQGTIELLSLPKPGKVFQVVRTGLHWRAGWPLRKMAASMPQDGG